MLMIIMKKRRKNKHGKQTSSVGFTPNAKLALIGKNPYDERERVMRWYDAWDGNVYVSVSGGKDSQVLAHIVKSMYPDVPCVFVNTGLEYNSVRLNAMEIADEILRPEMGFSNVITKYGYPIISKEVALYINQMQMPQTENNALTRNLRMNGIRSDGKRVTVGKIPEKWKFLIDAPFKISNKCCDVMKKTPAHVYEKRTKNYAIIGTMACESRVRKQEWIKHGCNAFDKKTPTSQPLSFWTEKDILQYIKENDLQIAQVYGEILDDYTLTGESRTGCVFCMFGIAQDNERFLKLKEIEPVKYDFVMRGGAFDTDGYWKPAPDENGKMGLGYKFVIDWLNEHGGLNIKY